VQQTPPTFAKSWSGRTYQPLNYRLSKTFQSKQNFSQKWHQRLNPKKYCQIESSPAQDQQDKQVDQLNQQEDKFNTNKNQTKIFKTQLKAVRPVLHQSTSLQNQHIELKAQQVKHNL